jgi:hypothetical protein
MYVPQHSENVCTSTFRKCMYLNIQKMYVPLHSENVCTSTFRKCMYLYIQKMHVPLHSVNVCTSTFRKCMYLYIQKMYVQYSQRHSMINHSDRRITHLGDLDISFVLLNISLKFLLHLECYLLSPKRHIKISKWIK